MPWQTVGKTRVVTLVLTGSLLPAAPLAAADPATDRQNNTLAAKLAESEAKVTALQQRIERLESRLNAVTADIASQPRLTQASQPATIAQAPPAAPLPKTAPEDGAGATARRPAPGAFEIDEDAAQRALERTLTQSGALLLPSGTFELTPSFTYRRTEQTAAVLATTSSGTVLANQQNRINEFTGFLDLRAGLPYNAQLELSLPYTRVSTTQVSGLGTATSSSGNGIGDATLGMAKTLVREKGWQPDLIGRVIYNFGNGKQNDGGVQLGGGFRQVQGELVALKRQDPLAFVGSIFYNKSFEKNAITPGDATGLSLAALLAASPATSLQLRFSQFHRQKLEQNGIKIPGSEQTYGILNLGVSSVLSRDMTLITQLGVGLGNDAPKYSFSVFLPILFR